MRAASGVVSANSSVQRAGGTAHSRKANTVFVQGARRKSSTPVVAPYVFVREGVSTGPTLDSPLWVPNEACFLGTQLVAQVALYCAETS